jgi:glycosyltransferase involved in cell wall biosynthesis
MAAILPDQRGPVKLRGRMHGLAPRSAMLDLMHAREPIDVLVVGPVPDFDRSSGSLRFYSMLRLLARKYQVTLLGWIDADDPRSPRYVKAVADAGVTVHVVAREDVGHGLDELLGQVGLCVIFEFFTSAERALGSVRLRRPDLPVVIDSVDVHYLREMRGAPYAADPRRATVEARSTRRRELGVYRLADLILAVTEDDRAQILRDLPATRVALIPNIHEVRNGAPSLEERRPHSLLFVGGFAHLPNVDAMRFFCGEVLGPLRRRMGQVELTIIGARPPREITELAGEGVVIAGWVPEMGPYLDSHCVAIAPLRFGAGMTGKVGQALASGLPVVTTSVGAEGMDLEDGKSALIADSPEAFAEAVARLCTDPKLHRDLQAAGLSHVRSRWDVAAAEARLLEAVESLRDRRPIPMTRGERGMAHLRDRYVRCGLARNVTRLRSVTGWYITKASRSWR